MRSIILLLLAGLSVTLVSAQPRKLIFVGNKDDPPNSFLEGETAKGLWVDLTRAVASKLGVPYSVNVEDWVEAQHDLQTGRADVLYRIGFSKTRADQFELSLPVSVSSYTLFSKGRAALVGLGDLLGLRVGVSSGGIAQQLVDAMQGTEVTTFSTVGAAFTALNEGRIDVFAGERWLGAHVLSEGHWEGITVAPEDFASLSTGFAVQKGNIALRDKLNSVITQLRNEGTFDSILKRWAPKQAIYFTKEDLLLSVCVCLAVVLVIVSLWVFVLMRTINQKKKIEKVSFQLSAALDQAKWGVAITNKDATASIYVNRELARMHGYETQELIGHDWRRLVDAGSLSEAKKMLQLAFAEGTHTTELLRLRKDGTTFPAIATSTVLKDIHGRTEGLVVNLLDITERKKSEEELSRTQKLESLGSRAAGIAHDFNNILASLRGQLDLASIFLQKRQCEMVAARLGKALSSFDRAKALTSRLVTFARGGTSARSVVALGPHIRDWVEMALVGSDILSDIEVAPGLQNCYCDVDQIGQVVHNLVINAKQASPVDGTISVRAENQEINGRYLKITVTDHGVGIPKDVLEKLATPFFTTRQGGSGLGLAVSFSIVKQHEGWIEVSSEVGRGSTFTIVLPGCSESASVIQRDPSSVPYLSGVCVVMDDEVGVRESVAEMLGLLGLEVTITRDGQEALRERKHILAKHKTVALYVLDLTVPGRMGGFETAEKLRREGDASPILFVSGYSEDVLRLTAEQFRRAGWLPKPFSYSDLCNVLSKLEGLNANT